jgi:hypothetical protein
MTLSALGIFSAAGAGGAAFSSDFELIQTTLITTGTSSFSFTGLGAYASTYKHLQLRYVQYNGGASANQQELFMRFNGSTGTYRQHELRGNGTTLSSGSNIKTGIPLSYFSPVFGGATLDFGILDILDFASSTKNKTTRLLTSGIRPSYPDITFALESSAWFNTSAITSLDFVTTAGDINYPARFSLYGIKG